MKIPIINEFCYPGRNNKHSGSDKRSTVYNPLLEYKHVDCVTIQ